MRVYKNTHFSEGIKCTFTEFKNTYKAHFKRLSDSEIKEAYKVATDPVKEPEKETKKEVKKES